MVITESLEGSREIGIKLNPLIIVSLWYTPVNICCVSFHSLKKKKKSKKKKSLSHLPTFQSHCPGFHLKLFWWLLSCLQTICLNLYFLINQLQKKSISALSKRRNLVHDLPTSFSSPLFLSLLILYEYFHFSSWLPLNLKIICHQL